MRQGFNGKAFASSTEVALPRAERLFLAHWRLTAIFKRSYHGSLLAIVSVLEGWRSIADVFHMDGALTHGPTDSDQHIGHFSRHDINRGGRGWLEGIRRPPTGVHRRLQIQGAIRAICNIGGRPYGLAATANRPLTGIGSIHRERPFFGI